MSEDKREIKEKKNKTEKAAGESRETAAGSREKAAAAMDGMRRELHAMSKKELDRDYVVPPLEGLWWAEDMASFTTVRDKSAWDWTMMIMTPEWVGPEMVDRAVREVEEKKGLPGLSKLRLEAYDEGLAVQIMHIGPYEAEGPVLAQMHQEWMPENGYKRASGPDYEYYDEAFDPRKPDSILYIYIPIEK